ncbi:RHS repeat domain-containing protein [Streptomyces zagrosensis]|uniref:RHS repeat-associated protein n=1 Tax=Streptomyces zagrosensis TaxID=1042984 RepID=A0A7W9UVV8_9ACTN|nr:RHS repeat-associated core domain-containing protein [Streptomyces zagrosensis]MBB5933123.1 RHS repeat-associated protein [Streptomyces zagrosensis]
MLEEVRFTWDGTRIAEQTALDGRTTTWEYMPGTHRPLTQTSRYTPGEGEPGEGEPGKGAIPRAAKLSKTEVDAQFHAIITDLVGTPTELVTPAGNLAWQHRTNLWGSPLPAPADGVDCPLRFPGQYTDRETSLNYNYFRYYDPETARYISPDPLGLAAGPDHHRYIDNPLRQIDPLGLYSCDKPGLDDASEEYIRGKHMPGGASATSDKSIFRSDEDLDDLVETAGKVEPRGPNENGFYERDVDAKRDIGNLSPDVGGLPTTWYRVVQDKWGGVITMHPISKPAS